MLGLAKMRDRVGALEAANAELREQLRTLMSRLEGDAERASARQADVEHLDARIGSLEVQVAAVEAGREEQAAAVRSIGDEALGEKLEAQRAALDQIQADIFRIDRQTALDFDEVRRTSAAIAERLLPKR